MIPRLPARYPRVTYAPWNWHPSLPPPRPSFPTDPFRASIKTDTSSRAMSLLIADTKNTLILSPLFHFLLISPCSSFLLLLLRVSTIPRYSSRSITSSYRRYRRCVLTVRIDRPRSPFRPRCNRSASESFGGGSERKPRRMYVHVRMVHLYAYCCGRCYLSCAAARSRLVDDRGAASGNLRGDPGVSRDARSRRRYISALLVVYGGGGGERQAAVRESRPPGPRGPRGPLVDARLTHRSITRAAVDLSPLASCGSR